MTAQGLERLKTHGFRPVGPWVVDVGRWSEVTYLFLFESLAERERLIAGFSATQDARTYADKVGEFVGRDHDPRADPGAVRSRGARWR